MKFTYGEGSRRSKARSTVIHRGASDKRNNQWAQPNLSLSISTNGATVLDKAECLLYFFMQCSQYFSRRDQPSTRRPPFGLTAAPHQRFRSPDNRHTGIGLLSIVETPLHYACEASRPEAARCGFDRFGDGAMRRREDQPMRGETSVLPAGNHSSSLAPERSFRPGGISL